jgi:hypothetical protein
MPNISRRSFLGLLTLPLVAKVLPVPETVPNPLPLFADVSVPNSVWIKGLPYLVRSSGSYFDVSRAPYPTLKTTNPLIWKSFRKDDYQSLGYPLGKTRRGFKKWLKRQK